MLQILPLTPPKKKKGMLYFIANKKPLSMKQTIHDPAASFDALSLHS